MPDAAFGRSRCRQTYLMFEAFANGEPATALSGALASFFFQKEICTGNMGKSPPTPASPVWCPRATRRDPAGSTAASFHFIVTTSLSSCYTFLFKRNKGAGSTLSPAVVPPTSQEGGFSYVLQPRTFPPTSAGGNSNRSRRSVVPHLAGFIPSIRR